jgi:hypothetical protein
MRLVEHASRQAAGSGRALAEAAADDAAIRAHLEPAAIAAALDPLVLTSTARDLVRRALGHRRRAGGGPDHG